MNNPRIEKMKYADRFKTCIDNYPFKYWLEDYQDGIGKYSGECCEIAQQIFDDLIADLIKLGPDAIEKLKVKEIERAVRRLNRLNEETPGLIETMEREEFCDLIDSIVEVAGIDPRKYGDGDGIASEWREW